METIGEALRAKLASRFPDVLPVDGEIDADGLLVRAEQHFDLARFLKEECGFTLYVTVVASHWPADDATGEQFEVATVLRRPTRNSTTFTWRVRLGAGETVASLVPLFAGADWQEREQFDLVGVVFDGHPDLRRLMLPEDWEGHPLRKEYAIDTPHAPWR